MTLNSRFRSVAVSPCRTVALDRLSRLRNPPTQGRARNPLQDALMTDKNEDKSIHLVITPSGEEVGFGISAKMDEGISAQTGDKGATGQGGPPVKPPPKPADAAVSAKPKK